MYFVADGQTKMYHLRFVVLVSISAVAAADNICCFEDEYSIQQGGNGILKVGGESMLLSFYCRAVVSYPRQITGADCVEMSPEKIGFKVVQNYKMGVQYYIVENGKGNTTCTKQPLPGRLFEQCLPSTMKSIGNFYFGREESDTLSATSYEITQGVFATVNAVERICAPLGVTIIGQKLVELETVGYFNYTKGIKDPSLFDIPSSCYKVMPMKTKTSTLNWSVFKTGDKYPLHKVLSHNVNLTSTILCDDFCITEAENEKLGFGSSKSTIMVLNFLQGWENMDDHRMKKYFSLP